MPTKCFAFGCKSILRKNHIKFYRLPTGKHRLKKWLQILKIGGTLNHRTAKICSLHFSRNQFLNSGEYKNFLSKLPFRGCLGYYFFKSRSSIRNDQSNVHSNLTMHFKIYYNFDYLFNSFLHTSTSCSSRSEYI